MWYYLIKEDMKICTQLWYETYFQIKMYQINFRNTFGNLDVEKIYDTVV